MWLRRTRRKSSDWMPTRASSRSWQGPICRRPFKDCITLVHVIGRFPPPTLSSHSYALMCFTYGVLPPKLIRTTSMLSTKKHNTNQWIDESINEWISQVVGWSVGRSVGRSVGQSVSQSVNQSVSQSINQSIIRGHLTRRSGAKQQYYNTTIMHTKCSVLNNSNNTHVQLIIF